MIPSASHIDDGTGERLRHTAGACRYAALVFADGAPARSSFAPTLERWAANFERRAAEADRGALPLQPDLFGAHP